VRDRVRVSVTVYSAVGVGKYYISSSACLPHPTAPAFCCSVMGRLMLLRNSDAQLYRRPSYQEYWVRLRLGI